MLAIIIPSLLFFFSHTFDAPGYKGPKSDHFDGNIFFNRTKNEKSFKKFLEWKFENSQKTWPLWREVKQSKPSFKRVKESQLVATSINHSTILVQMDGVNILTDPIWSERTSPVDFAGPQRHHKPAIKFSDLPPIDLVIISHNHYDHLDIPTLIRLKEHHNPRFLVGLGNSLLLKQHGINKSTDMDWEDSFKFKNLEFIFTEVRHWSSRGMHDRFKTLWGGFVVKSPHSRIYFAGDTGYDLHFKATYKNHGPFDLALLPIGAYEPRWFMKGSHMNPEDAVLAHKDLGFPYTLGIHFGTFQLTNEGIDDPIKDLKLAMEKHSINDNKFISPKFGTEYWVKK